MNEKFKIIFLVLVFVLLLVLVGKFVSSKTAEKINSTDLKKTTDSAMEEGVIELTDETFDQVVQGTDKKVLVDFYATWCGPCKMLSPILDEVASETPDVIFARVDVDVCEELANRYRIQAMPTLVVIQNGKEINRSVGLIEKEMVIDLLK